MRVIRGIVAVVSLALAACASAPDRRDIEGRYEYEPGVSLIIAARPQDEAVFAVINGARYPLRADRPDVFLNSNGTEVHFARDPSGRVIGYRVRENPELGSNPLLRLLDADAGVPAASWRARPPGAGALRVSGAAQRQRRPVRTRLGAGDNAARRPHGAHASDLR